MLYIGVPDWCLVLLDVFQSGVWFWWKLGFRQRFGTPSETCFLGLYCRMMSLIKIDF